MTVNFLTVNHTVKVNHFTMIVSYVTHSNSNKKLNISYVVHSNLNKKSNVSHSLLSNSNKKSNVPYVKFLNSFIIKKNINDSNIFNIDETLDTSNMQLENDHNPEDVSKTTQLAFD
ncbi:hypothetical protein CDIK_3516 [Cucumispora dikerogammari]|nr:hypothetical protein CDIK_3516 [Cucumispora dikerogammari]